MPVIQCDLLSYLIFRLALFKDGDCALWTPPNTGAVPGGGSSPHNRFRHLQSTETQKVHFVVYETFLFLFQLSFFNLLVLISGVILIVIY